MKTSISTTLSILVLAIFGNFTHAQTKAQVQKITANYDVTKLNNLAKQIRKVSQDKYETAIKKGFRVTYEVKGIEKGEKKTLGYFAKLREVSSDGNPIYYRTLNDAAARSTRTNLLHGSGGLELGLTGKGLTAYVWDGGTARTTHQEFGGRLSVGDSLTGYNGIGSDHATHVTGTMIAAGLTLAAKGMAFEANGKTFDWDFDRAEAIVEAQRGMLVSNHSYGYMVRHPRTRRPLLSPAVFGAYTDEARSWDEVLHDAPNYLMVVAAGNDGQDDTANGSPKDGNRMFDKLTGHCLCKNNLVVANARDVKVNSSGDIIGNIQITPSSSEGPADDLRIKPDITGNGEEVLSTVHLGDDGNTNDKYQQDGWTGTSMASPNVSGSLLLLQELYDREFDSFMRAASLKGLAIHTADDAGRLGPDAVFGWGLMNAKFAANTIVSSKNSAAIIEETNLANGTEFIKKFKAKGNVRVSICWTDLPGTATPSNITNRPDAVLVNDLNLRVKREGQILEPWLLTGVDSNTKGNNSVDPIERIDDTKEFATPVEYEVVVSHAASISGGPQPFTLIVTGDSINTGSGRITPGEGTPVNKEELDAIRAKLENSIRDLQNILESLNAFSNNVDPENSETNSASDLIMEELNKMKAVDTKSMTKEDMNRLGDLLKEISNNPKKYGVPQGGEVRPQMGIKPGIGEPDSPR
ncbi:MAG: S8 family serine peptidase [Mariniblastus sp.]